MNASRAYLFMHFHVQPVGHLVILEEWNRKKKDTIY